MMLQARLGRWLAALVMLMAASAAAALPALDDAPVCAEPTPLVVEDAPGGGEMVVLDAARRYVMRARRGAAGTLDAGCGHDHTPAPADGAAAR